MPFQIYATKWFHNNLKDIFHFIPENFQVLKQDEIWFSTIPDGTKWMGRH